MSTFDENDMSTNLVDLKLDEENELVFEVSISGEASGKPLYRFVCETGNMAFSFPGRAVDGQHVEVTVPRLDGKLTEGIYNSHLEVVVDNKMFIPLQVEAKFQPSTRVVAESVSVKNKPRVSQNGVTARVVSQNESNKKRNVTKTRQGLTLEEVYEKNKARKKKKMTLEEKLKLADRNLK